MDKKRVVEKLFQLYESAEKSQKEIKSDLKQTLEENNSKEVLGYHKGEPVTSSAAELMKQEGKRETEIIETMEFLNNQNVREIVLLGALFAVKEVDFGQTINFFVVPHGGDTMEIDDEIVITVSVGSAFAQATYGKKGGDKFTFNGCGYEITSVQ